MVSLGLQTHYWHSGSSCQVRLCLHYDLKDPLDHVASPFGVDNNLVCPRRDSHFRMHLGHDAVGRDLGMVLPIPRGRCGCRYCGPCFNFRAFISFSFFFRSMTSVANDKRSQVVSVTSPAARAKTRSVNDAPHSRSLHRASKCSALHPSVWGVVRGATSAKHL